MSSRKINAVSDDKKKNSLVLAALLYWKFMQLYAREDDCDSSSVQDGRLHLNAKQEVIFKRKLQFEKREINISYICLAFRLPPVCVLARKLSVALMEAKEN